MIQESLRQKYLEDGAVLVRGALDKEQLAKCRQALDWGVANPGPHASGMLVGTSQHLLSTTAIRPPSRSWMR
jgi:hypothetical protein